MTTAKAVAERLKNLRHTLPKSNTWSELDSDIENLIRTNTFAFLLAVAFDRGMR